MRQRVRTGNAEAPATGKFALPFDLVGDCGIQPFVMQPPVLTLGCGEQLGEQTLRPLVALGGIDGE